MALKILNTRRGAFYMRPCSSRECRGRIWNPPLQICFCLSAKTPIFIISYLLFLFVNIPPQAKIAPSAGDIWREKEQLCPKSFVLKT